MDVAGYSKSFVIDQGAVLGMDQLFQALYNQPLSDPKREGICSGLSMLWAGRRMTWHDETPEQRLRALKSTGGFRWGGKSQDIMMASPIVGTNTEEYMLSMFTKSLEPYSMRVKRNTSLASDPGATADMKTLGAASSKSHVYRLYSMNLTVAGQAAAHMVASYASGGKLGLMRHFYFFDPNMGEYRLSIDQAEPFLKAWTKAYADIQMIPGTIFSFNVER